MTRDELHDLVWSVPMQCLAKSFGISDVALAKHCRKANVPVPPRGWWARKEAGQRVHVTPLPPLPIGSLPHPVGLSMPAEFAKPRPPGAERADADAPPTFPDIALFRAEVEEAVGEVRVITRTLTGHPIVERLVQVEEKKRSDPGNFDQKYYGSRFATAIQQRRLRVLSAILGALNRSGCDVTGSTHAGEVFRITARGMHFVIVLGVEAASGEGYSPYTRWHGAAGSKPKLRLKFGDHDLERDDRRAKPLLEWSDGEQPLEAQLTGAVRRILVLAEEKRRAWAVQTHQWAVEDRRRREREQREAEAKAEADRIAREKAEAAARVQALLDEAEAIGQAGRIRAYVAEVRRRTSADPSTVAGDVETWASWALAEADRIDPVTSGRYLAALRRAVQG